MKAFRLSQLLVFTLFFLLSFSSFSSELFVADDANRVERVELFEFDDLQQQQHANALAKSLRCPQCQNQNLVESNSPMAMDLRLLVYQQVRQGKSDAEIIEFMTQRYGDFVRYNPPLKSNTLVLWLGPIVIFGLLFIYMFRLVKKKPK